MIVLRSACTIFAVAHILHQMEKVKYPKMNRREWLRRSAAGIAGAAVAGLLPTGCKKSVEPSRLKAKIAYPASLPVLKKRAIPLLATSISPLGISTMSMPKTGNKMDTEEGCKIIRMAAEHGVSLFETAWAYCDGDGERLLGDALSGRNRDSYFVATSMPTWDIETLGEARNIFARQISLLRTGHIDFYALQAVNSASKFQAVYETSGILDFLIREKKEGRIRRLGVDFLGDESLLDTLIGKQCFDFFKIPFNSVDNLRMRQSLAKMIENASKKGFIVFASNPTKDGTLRTMNGDASDILLRAFPDRPLVGWALREAICANGVAAAIDSHISNLTDLKDDIMSLSGELSFSEAEEKTWYNALLAFINNTTVGCTNCSSCMPCPYGVDIPLNFMLYNVAVESGKLPNIYDDTASEAFLEKSGYLIKTFSTNMAARESAFHCIECGQCLPRCPQGIAIPSQMNHISRIIDVAREAIAKKKSKL